MTKLCHLKRNILRYTASFQIKLEMANEKTIKKLMACNRNLNFF